MKAPAPITDALDAERKRDVIPGRDKRKIFPTEIFRDGRLATFSEEKTLAMVLQVSTFGALFTSDEQAKLATLESQFKDAMAQAEKFSTVSARDFFSAQSRKLAQAVVGGGDIPKDIVTHSEQAIHEDYRAKRQALTARLSAICEQAAAVAAPIIDRSEKAIVEFMRIREESESAEANEYGITYYPSELYRACASILLRLRSDRIPVAGSLKSPASMVRAIVAL